MKHAISALALTAACLVPSLAAQPKTADVYVSVVDSKGEPVTDLRADEFRVREDGTAREVLKAGPATEPLTVALLVDDSQATTPASQMIREAVDAFIGSLAGKAEIALITFGERPTILVDYTKDQQKLLTGAKRIFPRANAGAYLMEALVEVSRGFQNRKPARPVIAVLMMENSVEFSNRYHENVTSDVIKSGAALHVISLGQPGNTMADEVRNRDQAVATATERTGGRRDNVLALTAAASRMKQLSNELQHQYLVTYGRPDTLIPPDKMEVTVSRSGVTARARTRTGVVGAK